MVHNSVAIHLADITAAEKYYTNVMKFRLLTKSEACLQYDAGRFLLSVDSTLNKQPRLPGFSVNDLQASRRRLLENGCRIVREAENSLTFCDPFGIKYEVHGE
jgi:catechol 2,3-dioxygenase-like lactoylglutathione lyase family enzyme